MNKKVKGIKIKLGQIVTPDFRSGINKLGNLPLKFAEGYQLAKALKVIDAEILAYEVGKISFIKKYGVPIESDPTRFNIKPEFQKEYITQLEEIQNKDIDINLEKPIKISLIETQLTPNEIKVLLELIEPE